MLIFIYLFAQGGWIQDAQIVNGQRCGLPSGQYGNSLHNESAGTMGTYFSSVLSKGRFVFRNSPGNGKQKDTCFSNRIPCFGQVLRIRNYFPEKFYFFSQLLIKNNYYRNNACHPGFFCRLGESEAKERRMLNRNKRGLCSTMVLFCFSPQGLGALFDGDNKRKSSQTLKESS